MSLYASRLAMGVLQAGIFPCATLIMAAWLPPGRRAFASGILNSCMLIGGAVVSNLTAVLLAPKGPFEWRTLFVVYAIPGFLWAALNSLFFINATNRLKPIASPTVRPITTAIANARPSSHSVTASALRRPLVANNRSSSP